MTQAATTTFGCMGIARESKADDDLKRVTVEDDTGPDSTGQWFDWA